MLSHEFKTPLTVVLSSLQLLRRRLCRPGKDIADGVEKYLDYAEQNLYKTLRLAANILDAQYADVRKRSDGRVHGPCRCACGNSGGRPTLCAGVRRYAAV